MANLLGVCVLVLTIAGTPTALASACRHLHGRHHACSEPSDLKQRLDELHTSHAHGNLHETFYMLPFLREAAINQTKRHNFCMGQLTRSTTFSGSKECPGAAADDMHLGYGDPCPTYNTLNNDPNRYPRVLMETRCRCSRCQGIQPKSYQGVSVRAHCEGIYFHVRVLRRTGCQEGVYQYAAAWEKLQTGCACRLASVQ